VSPTILVISDLHLGGEPTTSMCSPRGRARLTAFLRHVACDSARAADIHLVLAGDIVDFLAEDDADGGWSAFSSPQEAVRKFRAIADESAEVWAALREVVGSGAAVTLMLGNHDLELCLPPVRAELLHRLGRGAVQFLYDNEALRIGPVLIEHGNRYDTWNAVSHDSLRRVRSRVSRGEAHERFPVPPGSDLVVRAMNRIKAEYGFVDLLKPEASAALPLLAALDGTLWRRVWPAVYASARAAWRRSSYDRAGRPSDDDLIASPLPGSSVDPADLGDVGGDEVPAYEFPDRDAFVEALTAAKESADDDDRIGHRSRPLGAGLLVRALRRWAARDLVTWDVEAEGLTYRRAAQALADQGAKVVVFGHTHLAKRVALGAGRWYLNSGTWADLMRVPSALLEASSDDEGAELARYLDALRCNDLAALRRTVPTFARVVLDDAGQSVVSADVHFFDDAGPGSPISSAELALRMT
jgi:UDP-2,3-diacylglucosamine pyrophosphatase LpxH